MAEKKGLEETLSSVLEVLHDYKLTLNSLYCEPSKDKELCDKAIKEVKELIK